MAKVGKTGEVLCSKNNGSWDLNASQTGSIYWFSELGLTAT